MAPGSTDDGIILAEPLPEGKDVRITGVETFCLRYDMPYALTYARGEYSTREALLVKVTTSDPSIFGWGESAMWGGPHAVTAAVIEKEIYPLIAGQEPRRP